MPQSGWEMCGIVHEKYPVTSEGTCRQHPCYSVKIKEKYVEKLSET